MKKIFTLCLSLCLSAAMMAQQTPQTKVIEVQSQSVSITDGSLSNLYRSVNRFDKEGRNIEYAQYGLGSDSYNGGEAYIYDDNGIHVCDSSSTTKWVYEHDAEGRIVKKTKYILGADGEFMLNSYQYVTYNEAGDVATEVNRNLSDQMTDSLVYNYEDGRLITVDTYLQATKTTWTVQKRLRYIYNELGKVARSLTLSVYKTTETITRGNGYKYDEMGRLVADTVLAADGDPRYLTVYKYDGDDTRSSGNEYFRLGSDDEWYKSEIRKNVYGVISSARAPQVVSVIQTNVNGPVQVTVAAPEDKEGYQGYRLLVDHQYQGRIHTSETIELSLPRGVHEVRAVAVYDGVEANTSNRKVVDVEYVLPKVSNVRVRTMEYKYSWTMSVGWDAPEVEGLHLTGYRVEYPTPWGYSNSNSTKNLTTTFTYSSKDVITVKVFAVYSEGESDATELEIDLTDTNNMVTEHWHNVDMKVLNSDGTVNYEHYYYLDNNGNISRPEKISSTIIKDEQGNPISRYFADRMDSNYSKLLSETTDSWNAEKLSWEKYTEVSYKYNSYNQLVESVLKSYNADKRRFETIGIEEFTYDDAVSGTQPAERKCYMVLDDVKKLLTRYVYEQYMDPAGVQRIETATVYVGEDLPWKIVKTYRHATVGTEVHLDSVFTYDYATKELELREMAIVDPATGLDAAYVVYDTEGNVISKKEYSASKEYHATHLATDLSFDGYKLTWTAPARRKGLDGYRILVNDIQMDEIKGDVTEYSIAFHLPVGTYDFAVVPVYDGNEATTSAAFNGIVMEELNPTGIVGVTSRGESAPKAMYNLAGQRVSCDNGVVIIGGRKTVIK